MLTFLHIALYVYLNKFFLPKVFFLVYHQGVKQRRTRFGLTIRLIGSYMIAHVLLNLLNELGKRDKMRGLPSILSLFRNEFNKFNNTRARMLDSIYHMTNTLKSDFWRKNVTILSL